MDVYRKIPEHVLGRIAVAVSIYIGLMSKGENHWVSRGDFRAGRKKRRGR